MLKYTRDDQGLHMEMDGNLLEIVAEATYLIRTIYERLCNQDKEAAEAFKEAMKRSIASDDSRFGWTVRVLPFG